MYLYSDNLDHYSYCGDSSHNPEQDFKVLEFDHLSLP